MGWGILPALVKPLTDAYTSRQQLKQTKESLRSKVVMAKDGQKSQLDLTDAEWEVVKSSTEDGTWKDEYVTILITFPYLLIMLGAVWSILFSSSSLMLSGILALQVMGDVGINMGFLMEAVVLAALSLKVWRR